MFFFLLCSDFFSKSTVSKNYFTNTIRVSNGLDSDQAAGFVGSDLRQNCLQRLLADNTSNRMSPNEHDLGLEVRKPDILGCNQSCRLACLVSTFCYLLFGKYSNQTFSVHNFYFSTHIRSSIF